MKASLARHVLTAAGMDQKPRSPTFDARAAIGAHARLRIQLARLGAERCPEAQMALMVELRPMLARHFKAEERAGGLFQGLLKLRPDRIESIEALRSQHRSILDDIEAILALVDADDAALRALVADFLDRIGEHERAENALVMSCLMG